jgi:lysophospholipase L1-like esterase
MRTTLAALAAVVCLGAALTVAAPALSAQNLVAAAAEPVRIMPLGDSITGSPGCWRALLWNGLQTAGHTGIDFVGTLPTQGCGVAHDGDNEGHGGILGTNIADQNLLPPWLGATDPDIVLMHLGTNDVWNNRSPATILAAYAKMVDQMRAQNPRTTVLVAQIIPMNPPNRPECGARVVALNQAIPAWAAGTSTAESPVVVVDQWTGFDTATDTRDGVHPNDAGIRKISDRWYPALAAALAGTTPPSSTPPSSTPPSSAPPSVPPSSTPPTSSPSPPPSMPTLACSVAYRQVGQWQGGFQGEVTVTNRGSITGRSWTATLTFADGQVVSQSWDGTHVQTGGAVRFSNAAWNGTLGTGATATAGFIGSWTTANTGPRGTCTIS